MKGCYRPIFDERSRLAKREMAAEEAKERRSKGPGSAESET